MKEQSKFSQQQQHGEQQSAAHESRQEMAREFGSAEDMLRFDAAHTMVPPEIAERLKRSAGSVPSVEKRSWWGKLFGK